MEEMMNSKGTRKNANRFALMVILVTALTLAGCTAAPATTQASYGYFDTITVTGFGEAYGAPDIATVQFGYSTSNSAVDVALSQADQTIDRITAALMEAGILGADIQTTNFSVWPEDQYDPFSGTPTGERLYRVENTLQVVIRDISLVSQVIETALDQGANNVYGLIFGMDDSSVMAEQARSVAVADGRARAEQLASELGLQLGEARIASETYGTSNYFDTPEFARGLGGGGGGPSISEGQLVVRVQVNMTFDLLR